MTNDRTDEILRHFDVVAESLHSEIRSVAEGHGMLAGGQARIEAGQQGLIVRVTGLETAQQVLAKRVEGLDAGLQNLAVGLSGLGDEVKAFRSEVAVEFSELRSMVKFSYAPLPVA